MQQQYSCPNCGSPVAFGAKFCTSCGTPLNWPTQQQMQPPPVYQQQPGGWSQPPGGTQQPGGWGDNQQQWSQGYRQQRPEQKKKSPWLAVWLTLVCIVVVVGGVIFAISAASQGSSSTTQGSAMSAAEIKSAAATISYDDLMRNNQTYVGRIVYYRGGVVQVAEVHGDDYVLRVATKKDQYFGYHEDIVWVSHEGQRLLEGDVVDMWGEVKGLRTYEAVLGNEVTLPELNSLHLELVAKAGSEPPSETAPASGTEGKITIKYSGTTVSQMGEWTQPDPGYLYLVLDLDIENEGYDSFDTTPYCFKVLAGGVEYSRAFMVELENELKAANVLSGGSKSGKIAFEVPAGMSSYQMKYDCGWEDYNIEWVEQ